MKDLSRPKLKLKPLKKGSCPHCSAPVRSMGNMWQEAGVVYAQAWCKQCEKIVKVEIERAEN